MEPIVRIAATLAAFGLLTSAEAAELKIVEVKAYAYLERAGRLSDNLIGQQALVDAPRGGALNGDTATALLVDFVFQGDKNASPKDVSATVDLTQINQAGERLVTHRAFANFAFGADGFQHKAVFLEGATCMPLAIEVHAGHASKSATLEFQCEAVRAPN
jgi:hypothetical protein